MCSQPIPFTRRLVAIAMTLVVLLAVGCQTSGPQFSARTAPPAHGSDTSDPAFQAAKVDPMPPDWLKPSTEAFRCGPGDRLELEILGKPATRATTFICPDGKLFYDLLPGLDVWGLTLQELKDLLEGRLSEFYARPQVSVLLTSVVSKRVWVLGRLNHSGVYPLKGPMTVIEAISQAGGLYAFPLSGTTDELADLNHSFIIRRSEMLPVNFQKLLREGDTSQNIYLEPDDFIYMPSSLSSQVYVLGAVNMPRPVGYMDEMGLATAIGKASGTQPQARLSHVAIVRGSLTEPKVAIVDFNAILTGRAPDVRLQPRDIVYVPLSPYRTLDKYAKLITDTFVRTVAANEGGHAADSNFSGVGVSTPLSH